MQTAKRFKTKFVQKVNLPYLLYLPKDYKQQKSLPLVMFLHGAGERGENLDLVKIHGIPKRIEEGQEFPFIAVSPQCPEDSWWTRELEPLKLLLDTLIEAYKVDKKRIYLTGLSMGGFGTFHLAGLYPKYFAAIAPICGGGHGSFAANLKNIPTWVFHGDADEIVPIQESQRMVNAVKRAGGKAKFTIYKGVGHDSWTQTYDNPKFYEWLLSHSKQGQKNNPL
jgi:predicted peptidase